MKTEQRSWTRAGGWMSASSEAMAQSAQLVLVFGATAVLKDPQLMESIRKFYPVAHTFGCSTAGEICGAQVSDDSLVTTASVTSMISLHILVWALVVWCGHSLSLGRSTPSSTLVIRERTSMTSPDRIACRAPQSLRSPASPAYAGSSRRLT
jgi:hypothetical protein